MPGKVGVKLINRLSLSKKYRSVRELVFKTLDKRPTISKDEMEKLVKKEYPKSNFFSEKGKGGHFTWYKHKWNKKQLEREFTLSKQKYGDKDEPIGYEGKKGLVKSLEGLVRSTVATVATGAKDRRISLHKIKRKMAVKARKKVLQHGKNSKRSRQKSKIKKVHH